MDNQLLYNWFQKGIRYIGDCFEGGILMSFDQLKNKYKISNNTLFLLLPIKGLFKRKIGSNNVIAEI